MPEGWGEDLQGFVNALNVGMKLQKPQEYPVVTLNVLNVAFHSVVQTKFQWRIQENGSSMRSLS